jgi:hypothetical protein
MITEKAREMSGLDDVKQIVYRFYFNISTISCITLFSPMT